MMKWTLSISKVGSVVIAWAICFQGLVLADIDYGAGKVNNLAANKNARIGGPEGCNYLALENQKGPSGVPVGGIGVGCFDYAPNGAFTRVAINNWHTQGGDNFCVPAQSTSIRLQEP